MQSLSINGASIRKAGWPYATRKVKGGNEAGTGEGRGRLAHAVVLFEEQKRGRNNFFPFSFGLFRYFYYLLF
jgi:hypothetical protein